MKRCHYEVLEVDRKATPAEIKTSYRKMALKYHPDKNSDEGAKERFVQINEAYNVLSDPNERTFYDNNREKLLFNKEEMSKEDLDQYTFGFNIWNYFNTSCFKGYDDSEGGFFAVYRDVFEKLKAQQAKAYSHREDLQEDIRKYQGFGDSTTNEDRVLKFYEDWENFSTYKTFAWSEEWDTRDANSRWVRREMEKENKKQRQTERKTYVKTIKDLLSYVRKRDPRFIAYIGRLREQEEKKQQERIERQKQKKKEKEEMKHVKQRLEEQRFREIEEYYRKQNQINNIPIQISHKTVPNNGGRQDEEHQSQFYCQICEKEFKSENQLRNHEKSKQHKQMVKDIQKEVLLKEEILQKAEEAEEVQDTKPVVQQKEEPSPTKKKKNKKKKNQQQQQKQQSQSQPEEPKIQPKQEPKQQARQETKQQPKQEKKVQARQEPKKEESSSDDEDHFMNTLLNNRNKKNQVKQAPVQQPQPAPKVDKKKQAAKVEESASSDEDQKEEKLGKAKLKKQRKTEQAQKTSKANQLKCKSCSESFPSKTKLFEHINKTGHATTK